eukprot:g66924.t1
MVFRPKAERAYESLAMCDELVRRLAKERAERAANPIGQASAPAQDVAATASVEELRAMLQAEKKTAEERLQVLEKEREAARLRAEIEQLRASR